MIIQDTRVGELVGFISWVIFRGKSGLEGGFKYNTLVIPIPRLSSLRILNEEISEFSLIVVVYSNYQLVILPNAKAR